MWSGGANVSRVETVHSRPKNAAGSKRNVMGVLLRVLVRVRLCMEKGWWVGSFPRRASAAVEHGSAAPVVTGTTLPQQLPRGTSARFGLLASQAYVWPGIEQL